MTDVLAPRDESPGMVRTLDVVAKAGLLLLLWVAIAYPDLGHLRGKGAMARAVGYPLLAFALPLAWLAWWRGRAPYPWLADLLVTLTCFTDVLGNRLDLYDTIRWFDDLMHVLNTGVLAAAFVLLTLARTATLGATVERALAFGVTAAVAWEVAEYVAFLRLSGRGVEAYADPLGGLTLGTLGVVVAAVVVHALRRRGRLLDEPMPWHGRLAGAAQQ